MAHNHRNDYVAALAAVTASIGTNGHSNWTDLINVRIRQLTEKMIDAEAGGERDALAEQIKGLRDLRDDANKRPRPRKDSNDMPE
jgi:hypothetical protein